MAVTDAWYGGSQHGHPTSARPDMLFSSASYSNEGQADAIADDLAAVPACPLSRSVSTSLETEDELPVHPGGALRWLVLLLSCLGMIGSYYCYDIPSALDDELSAFLGLSSLQFNLLYTVGQSISSIVIGVNVLSQVYSIPNTIIPLFGGLLTDRLGCNRCLCLFSLLIVIGQVRRCHF
jgi:hypothetical protein